ncbi:hypothetical protein TcWFU_004749 [Taenia crassiceps]|uniref:Uncharacterized protein n=1 Tax=Taenia crassiceps TaxID=6207 RepID=A0ABR4QKE2_9CEST
MTSGNDSKVIAAENKDAFSDARVPSHPVAGTKRQSLQKNKATANGSSALRSKKQKSHAEEKNSTLDSFVVKVPLPRSSVMDISNGTEETASIREDFADFAKASPISLKTPDLLSPTLSEEGRLQHSVAADISGVTTEKDEESVEIDLTRSDSTSSTPLSNGNR